MKKTKIYFLLILFILVLASCSPNNNGSNDENDNDHDTGNNNQSYEYKVINTFVTTDIYNMPAKITVPKTNYDVPALVMVHGSGPSDMDESIGKLKMFEDLAINLAKKGIASIRYDKRTLTYQRFIAKDINFTINDEVIDDALSAVSILKNIEGIDNSNIYILGHSFGGQLAPVIGNLDSSIKGVIMMASSTMHIIDLLLEQLKDRNDPSYNTYNEWASYFKDLNEVVLGEEEYLFAGAYQKYWVTYNLLNIKEETMTFANNKKMLLVYGKQDLQVKEEDFNVYKSWLKNNDKVIYKIYDNLNHCFVEGVDETYLTAYMVNKPIPLDVIDDIINFMKN